MITHRFRTIIGDIPGDWESFALKDALFDHKPGDWGDDQGEVKRNVIRSTNFTAEGHLNFDDVAVRCLSQKSSDKLNLKANDLLLERSGGGPSQPVGRIAYIKEDLPGFAFSNFIQRLRPDPDRINPQYLGWLLYELNNSGIVERLQHQTTQMRNLEYRDYLRMILPKPAQREQELITKSINSADVALQMAIDELASLWRLKHALMQQLFGKGIPFRHKSFKETRLGTIPDEWLVKKLKGCGSLSSGGTPSRENRGYYNGNIIWIKSGEIDYNIILDSEEKISEEAASIIGGRFPPGTLIIAMYGAGVTRGKVAILGAHACVNQAIACFQSGAEINNKYLFYWFQRNYERVRTLAAGSNQDNLSGYLLKNLYISVPKDAEQISIADLLTNVDAAITSVDLKIQSARRLKKSLLQNLLTGRVRMKWEAIK